MRLRFTIYLLTRFRPTHRVYGCVQYFRVQYDMLLLSAGPHPPASSVMMCRQLRHCCMTSHATAAKRDWPPSAVCTPSRQAHKQAPFSVCFCALAT